MTVSPQTVTVGEARDAVAIALDVPSRYVSSFLSMFTARAVVGKGAL